MLSVDKNEWAEEKARGVTNQQGTEEAGTGESAEKNNIE